MTPGTSGRYEVAVDSAIEFRVYPEPGRDPGQEPWLDRLWTVSESRDPITIFFETRRFAWHPGSDDVLPVVTVPISDPDNYDDERAAMERFLSAISFALGFGVTVYSSTASGFKKELDPPLLQQPRIKATIFPAPLTVELADESTNLSLSLALVREGLSSSSRALAYLSYWKAIEVAIGDPRHKGWIGSSAAALWPEEGSAKSWFKRLNATRISAAHAIPRGRGIPYNPNEPATSAKLLDDTNRIHQLAMKAVRERWKTPVRLRRRD